MGFMSIHDLAIRANQKLEPVQFYNFDEIKAYLETGLSVYRTTVYTPENLDQAEQDRKDLKAIKKKLTDKKKELEATYSVPIEEVKKQLDELIAMVKEPLNLIDRMIKENGRLAKKKEIEAYAGQRAKLLGKYGEKVIASKAFFNMRWLNITCKEKDWKSDIDKKIFEAADAIRTIQRSGGDRKATLMAFYFDKLSMEGAGQFLRTASEKVVEQNMTVPEDSRAKVGYRILKVFGTERQILQMVSQLELSGLAYEEIENGMPEERQELASPDFDAPNREDIYSSLVYLARQYRAEKLVLFGSRARGDFKPTSDIDLAVYGMPEKNRVHFWWDAEELPTLLKFDIVHITPGMEPEFLEAIRREGVVLYTVKKVENYHKAVSQLAKAVQIYSRSPEDDMYRDALIQRFEFTAELAWKSMREYLEDQGYVISQISPKGVVKEAYAARLIENQEVWLHIIDARNMTSHLYSEQTAKRIAENICTEYLPVLQALNHQYSIEGSVSNRQ